MKKTILVTGAAGFIGSHVSEKLLSMGYDVIGVDNFNNYYDPAVKKKNAAILAKNKGFAMVKSDICDLPAMEKLFSAHKIWKIIHLAARAGVRPSIENPQLYMKVNVEGTANLLEMVKKHNISTFVFASSSSVYGVNKKIPFSEDDDVSSMVSPYAVSKRAGELLCSNYHNLYGINVACLRFFTVYGPRGRPDMAPYMFIDKVMKGQEINKFGDGTTKRDYTFISDIVAGVVAALDVRGYEIVNLGNNSPVSLNEFIATVERVTGKKAKIKKMPMQPGDVPVTYADVSKAKRLFGYKPTTPISVGMRKLADWMKKRN
jgi:UDP-glucuronate 4-epimerase